MQFIIERSDEMGRPLRVDLQGLRGIGVLLVLIGHLWLWPTGAFAALDIFFVLSGFFITGILVDQFEERGRLLLGTFYLARFRRLVPTALTVIVVTILLTGLLYNEAKADEVAEQGLWAAAFASNWYFIEHSTNYFAQLGEASLIHYWSLSIEEQFYFVWPFLLWFALAQAVKRGISKRKAAFVVVGLATAISFAYSMWHSGASPTAAYFSTFDRVWEFGAGALAAIGRPWLSRMSARLCQIVAWAAAGALVASLAFLDYGIRFPAPWGLLPVMACLGLIAGGQAGHLRNRQMPLALITNAPMVYLGTISYSLYLWHLPVNFLLRSYFVEDTQVYRILAFVLGIAVGALSFHLLERPARRWTLLMTKAERRRVRRKPKVNMRPVQLGWVAVLLVAALGATTLALNTQPNNPEATAAPVRIPAQDGLSAPGPSQIELQKQRLRDALDAETFPSFDPPLASLTTQGFYDSLEDEFCTSVTLQNVDECTFSQPSSVRMAMVVGDSFAMAYVPAIVDALGPRWTVRQFTYPECPAWTLPAYYQLTGEEFPDCAKHHDETVDLLKRDPPDLLILTSAVQPIIGFARSFEIEHQGADLAEWALGASLEIYSSLNIPVAVLESPSVHADLTSCVTRFSAPPDCVLPPSPDWQAGVDGEVRASERYDASYVPTADWFCLSSQCPGFVGSTPVSYDGGHLTSQFSRSLAPLLRPLLRSAAATQSSKSNRPTIRGRSPIDN